ncbi:cobalamin-independent methionine synthase II family protein [Demequina zhanjiangensis]|uniref:Cobalamin-independent methionine synthase II family protein n=1 Tax=Demequina zhanjiangensis TaxID=3051659 RepID=A0ABT8G2W5_9MICO|nr:cobalamin-independent methionine synthase II family protein [Demequina sp. SYSU T00b26]MDN4473491.1 cobalamin-independent methionine synthase II family protein [Demequina sp. SYSU T00b26]
MSKLIQTTTAGSLPRTKKLAEANAVRPVSEDGFTYQTSDEFDALLQDAVTDVVKQQVEAGIDIVGDGEFGKAMSPGHDFGAWWSYSFQRTGGLALPDKDAPMPEPVRSSPGNVRLTSMNDRRDWTRFAEAYFDPTSGVLLGDVPYWPEVTGPLTYRGHDLVSADVRHLRAALDANGLQDGFITALAPGSAARIGNTFYKTEEEHIWAWAEVLKEEYKAIVDAGFTLQIDDPSLAESWDQINPEPSVSDYRAFIQTRIDAINHAIEGLPEDKVRLHLCWGSWHGPHTTDLEFAHIADKMLEVNAGEYSFEAANARHEHEWKVWKDVQLPEGKKIVPGIVGHSTNVVEHPDLVAERIVRFAELVGPENVIAATDCGLGGRVHGQIAWAKLESLGEGARRASDLLNG